MTLCALSKQPQIVFVLLELMGCRMTELRRRWSSLALVAAPGFILSPLWVLAVSADIAAWRLLEGETPPARTFRSVMEARVHVGAPTPLPAGSMDGSDCLGRPAVFAGA